jgi:hypothetical protein
MVIRVYDIETFRIRANEVHDHKYDYSGSVYTKSKYPIDIGCPKHGIFTQTADSHLRGHGCDRCKKEENGKKQTLSQEEFFARCNKIHNHFYDYSGSIYKGGAKNIRIWCPNHGYFWQNAKNHAKGVGCSKCANEKMSIRMTKTLEQFKKEGTAVHKGFYGYDKSVYINADERVEIYCPVHGYFWQKAGNHLQGKRCNKCASSNFSKKSLEFLEEIGWHKGIHITHAGNGGEYRVPGTSYKLDGYNEKLNMGFEYYGCFWHGCPNCHDPEEINPKNHKTFGDLYEYTVKRHKEIENLGITICSVWECEWKEIMKKHDEMKYELVFDN